MDRNQLAREIYRVSHLTGQFTLRSGKTSTEYFDKYRFEARPQLLREIAKQMTPLIPPGTDAIAALEMGGIPIATALSLATGIPVVFVRKEAKSYGTRQFAEGYDVAGKKLCVIEDVITTGGQVLESTEALRGIGAEIHDIVCVIYRGDGDLGAFQRAGLTCKALFSKQDLENAARGG